MASIDRPRGKPRVRWKDPNGTPHSRTCSTDTAARQLLREVQLCEDTGRVWEPERRVAPPTLRGIGVAWIVACERRLGARTVDNRQQHVDPFLDWYEERHGAGAGPKHLSRALLEAYWDHVRTPATGRYIHRRTESTARKHVETLHLLWEWAADREEYEGQVPRLRKMELPRKPPTRPRPAPSWAEMDLAIGAAEGWRRCVLVVMRCTGLRVQQVMGLRWEDLYDGQLTIRGELGKSAQESRGRVIPVAPALLAEWSSPAIAEWTDRTWIVPCPHDHRLVRARDIAKVWMRTSTRKAAWEGRPDHCFRAGFQTGLRGAGVRREATEYLVGHALPGVDASYIDPEQALHLRAAVALVPPLNVPVLAARQQA